MAARQAVSGQPALREVARAEMGFRDASDMLPKTVWRKVAGSHPLVLAASAWRFSFSFWRTRWPDPLRLTTADIVIPDGATHILDWPSPRGVHSEPPDRISYSSSG